MQWPITVEYLFSAFNPPVAGIEDHNEEGVYPAVDDEGNQFYEMTGEDVRRLTVPPESLKNGTPPLE